MKEGLLSGVTCPLATQDIATNLKNRNHAFKEYGYGPPIQTRQMMPFG
jgi:hypothetical protein